LFLICLVFHCGTQFLNMGLTPTPPNPLKFQKTKELTVLLKPFVLIHCLNLARTFSSTTFCFAPIFQKNSPTQFYYCHNPNFVPELVPFLFSEIFCWLKFLVRSNFSFAEILYSICQKNCLVQFYYSYSPNFVPELVKLFCLLNTF
jgi:hypothetical protein